MSYYTRLDQTDYVQNYRSRNLVIGRDINVIHQINLKKQERLELMATAVCR